MSLSQRTLPRTKSHCSWTTRAAIEPDRTVTISRPTNAGDYTSVTGLAPAEIRWRLNGLSDVTLRGSAADEKFVLTGTLVDAAL